MRRFKAFKTPAVAEIDLRKELNDILFGSREEIAKGQMVVVRRMRRKDGVVYPATTDELVTCSCKLDRHNEPSIDYKCVKCDGEGYLFDEQIVVGYKTNRFEYQDIEKYMPWGKNTTAISFFYIEYHEDLTRFDKVIEPVIDTNGKMVSPVSPLMKHNVHMAERFRLDNSRTEYWRLACWSE